MNVIMLNVVMLSVLAPPVGGLTLNFYSGPNILKYRPYFTNVRNKIEFLHLDDLTSIV
jgi:hypothetical protein